MTTKATKSIKYKDGNIKLSVQYNKKLSNCYVYMKFDTSEKWLLYVLLQKYIHEKVLHYGCNTVNEIIDSTATTNGIMFVCSEKKVLSNIVNTITYLCKTKLAKKELDKVCDQSANYSKLHKDVKNLSVFVTGKTVHLLRALTNSDDKKMDRFSDMLSNIQDKDIETAKCGNKEINKHTFNGNTREKLDLSVYFGMSPFVFEKDELILLEPCPCNFVTDYDFIQSRLKSFLVSCGSPGTPAANDTNGSKFAAKCKYILECLNTMTFIVADLHGFSYKFNDIKEIQNGVLSDSKAKIRECLKSLNK